MGNTSDDQRQSMVMVGVLAGLGGMVAGGLIVLALLPSHPDPVPLEQSSDQKQTPAKSAQQERARIETTQDLEAWFAKKTAGAQAVMVREKRWSCESGNTDDQADAFHRWFFDTEGTVPEVYPAVMRWLESDQREIDELVTVDHSFLPAGAQYRVVGEKQSDRAWCTITFVESR